VRDEPERDEPPERLRDADVLRAEPERDADVLRAEPERDAVFWPEPERADELLLRPPLRDELLRLREDELVRRPEELDERRELERRRRPPFVRRSFAGISLVTTDFVSCGIRPARYFAIRSSSRRMPLASFAVSLSPTASASVSIAV
jgi:hypothetical protein